MVTIIGLKKNGRTVELTTDDIKIAEAFIKQLETFSYIEKEEYMEPPIKYDTPDIINPGCIHVIVPKASSMSGR